MPLRQVEINTQYINIVTIKRLLFRNNVRLFANNAGLLSNKVGLSPPLGFSQFTRPRRKTLIGFLPAGS